jgi:DNA polymerase-3 subunit chi
LSGEHTQPEACQVDFYLLGEASPGADKLACRLALMALEHNQKVFIIAPSEASAGRLDELMWQYPEGRFVPHARSGAEDSARAPVNIGTLTTLKAAEVVINLCPEPVPRPMTFSRVLEIVPAAEDERQASRVKYRNYRNQGLVPRTHEINK